MYKYITTDETIIDVIKHFKDTDTIALDIETTALAPQDGAIRLIQMSGPDKQVYVIDCFRVSYDLIKELISRVGDEDVKTIAHSLWFEATWIYYNYGVKISRPHCTHEAWKAIQRKRKERDRTYEKHPDTLAHLCKTYVGVELDKSFQVSNWEQWTLDTGQLEYAALDSEILWDLSTITRIKADEVGAGWYIKDAHQSLLKRTYNREDKKNPADHDDTAGFIESYNNAEDMNDIAEIDKALLAASIHHTNREVLHLVRDASLHRLSYTASYQDTKDLSVAADQDSVPSSETSDHEDNAS